MEKRKQGRPRKFQNEVVLTIRLEQAMVDALDELAEQIYQDRGVRISRMDLIREAIHDRVKRGGQPLTPTEA
jgi:predicted transcriptional regulator